MFKMRFSTVNPFVALAGCLLIILLIPLFPFLLLIFFLFILFGRSISVRKQYERFRDSRFYNTRQKESRPAEPDVCDVECTVISSETVDDNKK